MTQQLKISHFRYYYFRLEHQRTAAYESHSPQGHFVCVLREDGYWLALESDTCKIESFGHPLCFSRGYQFSSMSSNCLNQRHVSLGKLKTTRAISAVPLIYILIAKISKAEVIQNRVVLLTCLYRTEYLYVYLM